MDAATVAHLAALKESLQTLDDSGADGFEGLLAAVLSEVCGQPFRLASSGSQRGRDGDSAFDDGATYFEAKLYDGPVPRSTVSNKILELSVDDKGQVDTWALCATAPVSTQHVEMYRQALAKVGIGCLILDWPAQTLPPLAVLLAMAPGRTEQFLKDHSKDKAKVVAVRLDLDAIATDSEFAGQSSKLAQMVREPALGLGLVKDANRRSLTQSFSDRKRARLFFGQPLAPLDPTGLPWFERAGLIGSLTGAFSGTPDEAIFVVLGEEGTGKSWLVAKAWLASTPTPLLVVFTADELKMPLAMHDPEGVLIAKLAEQSEGTLTEAAKTRWQRRFKSWRANPSPDNVRFVVWVDGLNQAQEFPWPRWMDGISQLLSAIGGRLIVTTTERHFAQRLRSVAMSDLRRIIVKEWTEDELRLILASRGIVSDRLSADVINSLRNPRILGIAMELLDAKEIEGFEELTVGRLLFEHIRRCERDGTTDVPADAFRRALQTHADTIIGRLSSQQHDDLMIFDADLDRRLKAVSNSRFFEGVAGDPDRYTIKDDGLPLALGLWLVDALRKEERNQRDPAARLADIIEPILALAKTSEVILSALQVACLASDCPVSVGAALAQYYIGLQNIPESEWPAFESLVKASPKRFLEAAKNSALSGAHLTHMRWLTVALLAARSNPDGEAATSKEAIAWLSCYSLAPERRMFTRPGHDPVEKIEAERLKRKNEIDSKVAALSPDERKFMETRLKIVDEKGLSRLHLLALELLSGTPLVGASDALVNWAFGNALNPGTDSPDKQFEQLVHLNAVDWLDTRAALLRASASLAAVKASSTGEWALVRVLRATGHSDDAARANEIAERLTKDRSKFEGMRRVDSYSDTDPCDPESGVPSNIEATANTYQKLDVTTLRQGRGATPQDMLFADAQPALARFKPDAAIAVQRAFARDVITREGLPKRQGILALAPDSAILDSELVDRLIEFAARAPAAELDPESDKQDAWLSTQYALFTGMPHKSGNEQLAILADLQGRTLLVSTLEQVGPADEGAVEAQLDRAVQSGDADMQMRVLSFVLYSKSPLSKRSREHVSRLLASPDKVVRSQAVGIAAYLRDPDILSKFVETGWDARALDIKADHYLIWYGSSALLRAAAMGILDPAEAVDRIAAGFYGFALSELPGAGAKAAATRIDAALKRATNITEIPEFPLVEQPVLAHSNQSPPLLSLVDEPQSPDISKMFDRLNETEEAYQVRQRRAWQAFDRFSSELTVADARIVLDEFSWGGFDKLVAQDIDLARSWATLLGGLPSRTFRSLHFFALGLAKALTRVDVAIAVALFKRIAEEPALVNRVVGVSKIPAESVAVWSSADVPEIKVICFERLDHAANDSDLAIEVLAAFSAGMSNTITEYVDKKLAIGEPSAIARAIMVSGYSDFNAHATGVLEQFAGTSGFIRHTHDAARYAYERNSWARQWFEKMKTAQSAEELWRYGVLFTKVVDGRYAIWESNLAASSGAFTRFFVTIENRMNNRIKKWNDSRQKKFFGQAVPDPIFLLPPVTTVVN